VREVGVEVVVAEMKVGTAGPGTWVVVRGAGSKLPAVQTAEGNMAEVEIQDWQQERKEVVVLAP